MVDWSVEGLGDAVTVVSPAGDVFPFVIASTRDLHLALDRRPDWRGESEPADAERRIRAAHGVAARWTRDMFGASPS